MARIRSIKPEFWSSPGTASASPMARLLFIAMWNWADDYGVGTANLKELEGFAYPNDAVADFPSLCTEVADSFDVTFYTVRGRPYYSIPSWDKHQRNERRAHGLHPGLDEADMPPDLQEFGTSDSTHGTSDDAHGLSAQGTGEQGNRGTGEQGKKNSSPSSERTSPAREVESKGERPRGSRAVAEHLNGTAHSPAANQIAEAYAASCTQRPPGDLLSSIAVKADGCLKSDYTPQQIAAGIQAWSDSDMHHPSAIPSFVHRIVNRPNAGAVRQSRSDTDFAQAESLKHFDAEQKAIG